MLSIRDCLDYCDLTDEGGVVDCRARGHPGRRRRWLCGLVPDAGGVMALTHYMLDLIRRANTAGTCAGPSWRLRSASDSRGIIPAALILSSPGVSLLAGTSRGLPPCGVASRIVFRPPSPCGRVRAARRASGRSCLEARAAWVGTSQAAASLGVILARGMGLGFVVRVAIGLAVVERLHQLGGRVAQVQRHRARAVALATKARAAL